MTAVPDPRPLEALPAMPAEGGNWLYGKSLSPLLVPIADGRIPIAAPGGVATLDADGKLHPDQRPPVIGGGGGFTPTWIPAGSTFVVPANAQAFYRLPILIDGDMIIDGDLMEI